MKATEYFRRIGQSDATRGLRLIARRDYWPAFARDAYREGYYAVAVPQITAGMKPST